MVATTGLIVVPPFHGRLPSLGHRQMRGMPFAEPSSAVLSRDLASALGPWLNSAIFC